MSEQTSTPVRAKAPDDPFDGWTPDDKTDTSEVLPTAIRDNLKATGERFTVTGIDAANTEYGMTAFLRVELKDGTIGSIPFRTNGTVKSRDKVMRSIFKWFKRNPEGSFLAWMYPVGRSVLVAPGDWTPTPVTMSLNGHDEPPIPAEPDDDDEVPF